MSKRDNLLVGVGAAIGVAAGVALGALLGKKVRCLQPPCRV
jgi:hypothetical protein